MFALCSTTSEREAIVLIDTMLMLAADSKCQEKCLTERLLKIPRPPT